MTAPEPSPEPDPLLVYKFNALSTFERWSKKGRTISYAVAAVAFAVTLVAMSKVTESGSLGFFLGIVVAFVAMMVFLSMIYPTLPMPVLRCPYCAGRVPLIEPPKPFRPFDTVKACPNCQKDLWNS